MSTAYLTAGYPFPIPVFQIRFRRLAEVVATELVTAIVDTGADMTIAPADLLTDLQAQDVQATNLVSQWGDEHPVILYIDLQKSFVPSPHWEMWYKTFLGNYIVDLEIENQVLPGVLVAGDETATEVILGRNVLNLLPLFLDGPHQQTYVVADAIVRRLRLQK